MNDVTRFFERSADVSCPMSVPCNNRFGMQALIDDLLPFRLNRITVESPGKDGE